MSLLFDEPTPGKPDQVSLDTAGLRVLADIAETLSEIAAGIHMIGANHARTLMNEPPAFNAEDFGFDLLIPNPDKAEADRQARIAASEEEVCRVCGCSDTKSCPGGCTWAEPGLCSSCSEKQALFSEPEVEPCTICSDIDTHRCPGGQTWGESGLHSGCAEKQEASGHEVGQ
jgi:hypothetical protein